MTSSCHKLEFLALGGNKLETIDLSPLVSCTNLLRLDLGNNQIHTLDVSPLTSSPLLGQQETKSHNLNTWTE
ncbi:MAG: leucine-rich repeat domain-containing protein [Candidatus Thorarchaeota archaeon]